MLLVPTSAPQAQNLLWCLSYLIWSDLILTMLMLLVMILWILLLVPTTPPLLRPQNLQNHGSIVKRRLAAFCPSFGKERWTSSWTGMRAAHLPGWPGTLRSSNILLWTCCVDLTPTCIMGIKRRSLIYIEVHLVQSQQEAIIQSPSVSNWIVRFLSTIWFSQSIKYYNMF